MDYKDLGAKFHAYFSNHIQIAGNKEKQKLIEETNKGESVKKVIMPSNKSETKN
jgi:hypothetical protein